VSRSAPRASSAARGGMDDAVSGGMLRRGLSLLLVTLSGCAATAPPPSPTVYSATAVEACPVGVPGTRIQLAETAESTHVFLQTWPSNVDELRLRVRAQAERHGPGAHHGPGHLGTHEGPRTHGLRLWSLGPTRVTVEDIPGGARLVVQAADPARREEVRIALRRRIAVIDASRCVSRPLAAR